MSLPNLSAAVLAFTLAFPVAAEILLCPGGVASGGGQHGAKQAYFSLPLDKSLNAAHTTTVVVSGAEVLLDVALGPGPAAPVSHPSCFFISATLPGSLEPGDYVARWTVRRLVECATGTCEAERAVFTHAFTVQEPLVCSDEPRFDLLPWPPVAGLPIKALHARPSNTPYALSAPVVTISGTTIEVRQAGSYNGPAPPPMMYCLSSAADLGMLAGGDYTLTWVIDVNGVPRPVQYSFHIPNADVVPTLDSTMAFALVITTALAAMRALR